MIPPRMSQWQGADERAAELDLSEVLRLVATFQEVMFDDQHGYLDRLPEDVEADLLPIMELVGVAAEAREAVAVLVASRLLRDTAAGVDLPNPLRAAIDALPY